MATRGKAAVSTNGSSISKSDVEVEARLNALEAKVNHLIEILNDNPSVVQYCNKIDGVRKLPL